MSEPSPNPELPAKVVSSESDLPDRPKVPEIGDNPDVDQLRRLPDLLGFKETLALAAERLAVADWLMTNASAVEYALDCPDDTPELAALQLHWSPYVDITEAHVDQMASEGRDRDRAMVGMLIDHALIYYDSGLTHQFWERIQDILDSARGYGLLEGFPEISRAAGNH